PRLLMFIGITLTGGAFIAMYWIESLWMFYLIYGVIMAAGFRAAFGLPIQVALANWFRRRRSRAFALYSLGTGFGGFLIVPTLGWLVAHYSWRVAGVLAGLGVLLVCLPLACLVRHKPEPYGYLPDGDPPLEEGGPKMEDRFYRSPVAGPPSIPNHAILVQRQLEAEEAGFTVWEAMKTSSFWFLTLGLASRSLGASSIGVHQVAYLTDLTDLGISPQLAANSLGLMSFMSLPGRLVFGWLGDFFNKRFLVALCFLLQSVAFYILANISSMTDVWIFVVVYGIGWGGAVPVQNSMRADYFGRRAFGTITGAITALTTLTSAVGPLLAGSIHDLTQSYRPAFLLFTGTCLLGAILLYFAKPPEASRRILRSG
ncbi:MAG: MFS transporter, partial [Candidatus Tectomicrobia bacterium]|nr:MFS transporter [Candidatus Tectomicrobia bacterium]